MTAQSPHLQRCDNGCAHHKKVGCVPDIDECDILDHTPTTADKKLIRQIGCASHSSIPTTPEGHCGHECVIAEMWAAIDPDGKVMDETVTYSKNKTEYNAFTWGRCGDDRKASDFIKEGYRVVKVKLIDTRKQPRPYKTCLCGMLYRGDECPFCNGGKKQKKVKGRRKRG